MIWIVSIFLVTNTSWCTSRVYFRTTFLSNIINDLSRNLSSPAKLFADNVPILCVVHNINSSNDDVKMISDWACLWKMSFNLNLSKQAWQVIFPCKSSLDDNPAVTLSNSSVAQTPCQKHLGLRSHEKRQSSYQSKNIWSLERYWCNKVPLCYS